MCIRDSISLSTWFRDYVYIPLGGNRCSPARHIFNPVSYTHLMMIGTVLCLAFASPLMTLFTENVRTVVIGAHALRIICVGFLVSAVSVTASGALEGLGKGTASLVISLCRYTCLLYTSRCV